MRPARRSAGRMGLHVDGAPECRICNVYILAPAGAPFGGFCPRLQSLCGDRSMGTVARLSGERTMHALRLTMPQPWLPVGTVFHRAGRTGAFPAGAARRQTRPPCVPHRHARRLYQEKRRAGPPPRRFPRIARGRPFSADPVREVSRPPLTPRADPASPQRLAVYPRRDGGIVGTGLGGGDGGG